MFSFGVVLLLQGDNKTIPNENQRTFIPAMLDTLQDKNY